MTPEEALEEAAEILEAFLDYGDIKKLPEKQKDRIRQCLAALSAPCACGGGKVLAEGLMGGWIEEHKGETGILGVLVDCDSVGDFQLDSHVRIVEVSDLAI